MEEIIETSSNQKGKRVASTILTSIAFIFFVLTVVSFSSFISMLKSQNGANILIAILFGAPAFIASYIATIIFVSIATPISAKLLGIEKKHPYNITLLVLDLIIIVGLITLAILLFVL